MRTRESFRYILEHVNRLLSEDDNGKIDEMVEMVLSAPKIFVYGVGRSGLVGKAFAIRLVQLGLKVYFIGETITPFVEGNDMVLIVSNTGETMSAIQTANIARRVGAKVLVVTSKDNSKLAHTGNLVICLNPAKDEKTDQLAPLGTLFEAATFLFFDGIVAHLMEILEQKERDMRKRHAIWV